MQPLFINLFVFFLLKCIFLISDPCVDMGVPIGSRATKVTYCNSCGDDVHVTITQYCSCAQTSSDVSIPLPDLYTISRQYQPCNSGLQETKVLMDTIKALRLSGWYYERSLDWQVITFCFFLIFSESTE